MVFSRAKILARRPRSYYRIICDLLNVPLDENADVPIAAVCRLLDAKERPQGHWLRADPVHLHADRDRLVLI